MPTNLATISQTDGSVLVTFDAVKGPGTVFLLQRQFVSEGGVIGDWTDTATLSDKRYLDENVPSGLRLVNYRVRAQTTNGVLSPWTFPVPFYLGTGDGSSSASDTATRSGDSGGPDGLTIKDAQTAEGKPKAG